MQSQAANQHTSSVRKSPLALLVDAIGEVAQANTTTNLNYAGGSIQSYLLERLQIDDYIMLVLRHFGFVYQCNFTHRPILSSAAEARVRVTTRLRLDLQASLCATYYGVLNLLVRCRQNDDSRLIR